MDKQELLSRIVKLKQFFDEGKIPTISNHEIHPNYPKESRERYLYFTLPPCLNFQRSSPAMWQAAYSTWNDPETNYLFYPEKVVITPYEKIQKDLVKHKLSLQRNKHTQIWISICKSLHERFDSDPRKLIALHNSSVLKVIEYLRENKSSFPYLNGPKMSNYWLYILDHYTDIKIKDKHLLSIIPDTHVAQCSIHLKLTQLNATPEVIAKAWFDLLEGHVITPVEMHPVLWNWSRNNFLPEV
ncbi:MAG: hypothetical protein JWN37_625 [Candidatus Nomurabacteria bacterium]|nr:hypothetical protein [Candidatus Nomurabacteria bacterium]